MGLFTYWAHNVINKVLCYFEFKTHPTLKKGFSGKKLLEANTFHCL